MTQTVATGILCGNHPGQRVRHVNVDAVRACYREGRQVTWTPAPAEPVEVKPEPQTIEDGMYVFDGQVYKVQHAVHGSGRQYAKRLAPIEHGNAVFEYAPGVVAQLRPEHRMSLEQAQEYGALYGVCARCGRTLTAEDSIERMMGPVCITKI